MRWVRMKHRRDKERRLMFGWNILLVPLLLLVVVGLLIVWVGPARPSTDNAPGNPETPAGNPATPAGTAQSPDTAQSQSSANGYQYQVLEERYVTHQQDGSLQVQQRRRESWTAPDGWTWARQTGFDPARFILPPSVDWQAIRASKPTAADVARALDKSVVGATASERPNAEFNFVNDFLGTATLPDSCLPLDYRRAIVTALARNPGVTVKSHVTDPLGRADSTQITLTSPHSTISIFLDADLQYLAYTGQGDDGERAYRVVSDRRHVDRIPDDLLAQLGGDRVAKVIPE